MTHLKYEQYGAMMGAIVFVVSWIYCIVQYGYLLGVGLGWLPSLIVCFIARYMWDFILYGFIFCFSILLLFATGLPQQVHKFLVNLNWQASDKWVSLFFFMSIICFLILQLISRVSLKNKSIIYWMGLFYGKVKLKINS